MGARPSKREDWQDTGRGGQWSLEGPDPDIYLNGVLKAKPQMKTSCSAPVTESALESKTAGKKERHGTNIDEPGGTQRAEQTACVCHRA